MTKRTLVLLLLTCAFGAKADVVNITTSTTYATFEDAYAAANAGETLELDDGTYNLHDFALNKNVNLAAKNIAQAVIRGPGTGVSGGYPLVISEDVTFTGLRFTHSIAPMSFGNVGDVTVNFEDVVFHHMNHGIAHNNGSGSTDGTININRATFYGLIEEAIYVDDGGSVTVTNAIIAETPGLGLLRGANEGANTLQLSNYALLNTANQVNDVTLATLSNLATEAPVLADPENGNFALVEGSVGLAEAYGVTLPSVPAVTLEVSGNGETIANNSATPAVLNNTAFGSIHASDSKTHQFTLENMGYSEDLLLTGIAGELIQITGAAADQFSVAAEPASAAIQPRTSQNISISYSPSQTGSHQAVVSFNNNVDDPFSFTVSGEATNTNPVANDDTASVDEDTQLDVSALLNDIDADGDDLTITDATLAAGEGSVSNTDSVVRYTPSADYNGVTSINYTASDGFGSDTATVNITVNPINDAPTAVADTGTTDEEQSIQIDVLANDTDVDSVDLTLVSVSVVSGAGNASIVNGMLVYNPAENETGVVQLSYVVSDGSLTSTQTVSVTINNVNDGPVLVADTASGHFLSDIRIDALANDSDIDGDALNITAATADHGSVSIDSNELLFSAGTYTPNVTINYSASDGDLTASSTVALALSEYQGPLAIGSGAQGHANGDLASATFQELYTVAAGADNLLYAASGHLIRVIDIANDSVTYLTDTVKGHRDGALAQARFSEIESMVYDANNAYLYVAEVLAGNIRRIDLRRNVVNTIRRNINQPLGLALSSDSQILYAVEHGEARVLRLNLAQGVDDVLVGNGSRGNQDGVGTNAQIDVTVGMAMTDDNTLYIADRTNQKIRRIDIDTRTLTTLNADFEAPSDLVVRDANTLIVLDRFAHQLKRLTLDTENVSVLPASDGELLMPVNMASDAANTLYVADSGHHQIKAFSIDTLTTTVSHAVGNTLEESGDTQQGDYFVRDLAGNGHPGLSAGLAEHANFYDPDQVVIAGSNQVYASNRQNTLMRIDRDSGAVVALFPDDNTNQLVEASAYGLGVTQWGVIDGMRYRADENHLYVFAGGNTLYNIDLADNSYIKHTLLGLTTGGDFVFAPDGQSIYMVDKGAHSVVQIDAADGTILNTFSANNGILVNTPTDIAIDRSGLLYIANWGQNTVITLDPENGAYGDFIWRTGGFTDGVLASATIGGVYGLEMGQDDVLFLLDRINHAVRKVDTQASPMEIVTLVGDGEAGLKTATTARFNNPTALAVDVNDTIVMTDDGNHRIRLISESPNAALEPFDVGVTNLLTTKEDGTPVVPGTIPLADFPIIADNPTLNQALAPLPMYLVDSTVESVQQGPLTYETLTGEVSVEIPAGANGESFTLHGAELLVFNTRDSSDSIGNNNSFFIKISLYRFLASALASFGGVIPPEVEALMPNQPIIIGYSDKNLDETAIKDLPQNVQDFFIGVFDTNYGIPIFNDKGSINTFLSVGYNSLPDVLRKPLETLGIDATFIQDQLGIGGGLVTSLAVENIGFVIDAVMIFIPGLQDAAGKDRSSFAVPALNMGLVLPGVSLPGYMQDAVTSSPLFQVIGFEPDAAVQLRFYAAFEPTAALGGNISITMGTEGALRIQMPRILNAGTLADAPTPEPLDVRLTIEKNATVSVGLNDGSVGAAEASAGVSGTLRLVNYWKNPFGIRGVGVGKAVFNIGGQAAAGLALNNAGVGVDVFGGLGGELACLDDNGEVIGNPQAMAGFIGFKIGVPPIPTGVGIEVGGGGMSFLQALQCRAKAFISIALGMGDTLLVLLPEGPERELVRAIQNLATGSIQDLEQVLLEPLKFEPIRVYLDGVRFAGDFYLATPGVVLPGRIETVGLRSSGKIEIKPSANEPWYPVADASIGATFADGLTAQFSLADYNLGNMDLIVMENVQGSLEVPIPGVHTSKLDFTGRQVFLGLDSSTTLSMSVSDGILINSQTSIEGLGEMMIDAHTVGTIIQWPPIGGADDLDLQAEARFNLDLNHVAAQIHAAVNGVLNGANAAYRSALDTLAGSTQEEQALQSNIDHLEAEIKERTDEINNNLRPGFDSARSRLTDAQNYMAKLWEDIDYYEWRKDNVAWRCDGWPWNWHWCAETSYWYGREVAARGLVWGAGIALDLGYSLLGKAEDLLDDAIYQVSRILDPRLNAYRLSLVTIKAGKEIASITARALEAANRDIMAVSNALRDAANITVHNASATIGSLFDLLTGQSGVQTDLDISVLGLRCQTSVDFNLNYPVETMMNGIRAAQNGCAADYHDDASEQQQNQLMAQYVTAKAKQASYSLFSAFTTTPANDSIDDADTLDAALPLAISASNLNVDEQNNGAVEGLAENTLWYRWTPVQSATYTIRAEGVGMDTVLQLHRADIEPQGSAASLIAADLIPASDASLTMALQANVEYLIGVASQLGAPGDFTLHIDAVETPAPAVNDAFVDAIAITGLGGSMMQDNHGATVEAGETGGAVVPKATTWWKLNVAASGLYTINTLGSTMDTIVRAYRADAPVSVTDLVWVKSADDLSIDPRSQLTIIAEQGETLWFSVDSKYGNTGTIAFNWSHTELPYAQLPGDHFADAVVLDTPDQALAFSNVGATTELQEPLHAGASNHASLWFKLTAAETANYLIETKGSDIETALAVYLGTSLNALTEIASVDGNQASGVLEQVHYSAVRVNLTAGETYTIALAGVREAEGDIVLQYGRFDLNDRFDSALAIPPTGDSYTLDISQAQLETNEPDYVTSLASDYLPENLLGSFNSVGGDDVAVPDDEQLLAMLQGLYESNLADLQARSFQHSLWYSYAATSNGDLVLTTEGSEPDTAVFIFTGDSLANLQPQAWNDDSNSAVHADLRHSVTAGESYYIALVARGPGVVNLDSGFIALADQSVANGTPDTAIPVTYDGATGEPKGSVQGDNSYAKNNAALVKQHSAQDDKRLWWSFTSAADGILLLDTDQSDVDTLLEVYKRNNANELTLVTLNDNYRSDLTTSRIAVMLIAGETVFASVDSLRGGSGSMQLNYAFNSAVTLPANDMFESPIVIEGDQHSGSYNSNHSYFQPNEVALGALRKPNSQWFRWTPTITGEATISTSGSALDTLLGIYADNDGLRLLASNDDVNATDKTSTVTTTVNAGATYYLAVAGKRDVQGEFNLTIDVQPIDSSNQSQNTTIENASTIGASQTVVNAVLKHAAPENNTGSNLVNSDTNTASSLWWSWQAPQTAQYSINSAGSGFIPLLEVYVGENKDQIVMLSADTGSGQSDEHGQFSEVIFDAQKDQQYFVRISSGYTQQGELVLNVVPTDAAKSSAVLNGDVGEVAAAIEAAGRKTWQWTAPLSGLVQVTLKGAEKASHSFEVSRKDFEPAKQLKDATPEITEAELRVLQREAGLTDDELAAAQGVSAPSFQFIAEKDVAYDISVVSTERLLGNATLSYDYLSRVLVDVNSALSHAFIEALKPIAATLFDPALAEPQTLDAATPSILAAMSDLLQQADIAADRIEVEFSVAEQTVTPAVVYSDIAKVRIVAIDRQTNQVLLSSVFDPHQAQTSSTQYQQVLIGNAAMTDLQFGDDEQTVGMQLDLQSFDGVVKQAFMAVEAINIEGMIFDPALGLMMGDRLFAIELDLYDGSNQRYDLDQDSSVVRQIRIQQPVNTQAIIEWLDMPEADAAALQNKLNLALAQNILRIYAADNLAALQAGEGELIDNARIEVDLGEGVMTFYTPHLSVFALASTDEASAVVTPLPFAFEKLVEQPRSTLVISEAITVSGDDTDFPVSVSPGSHYAINGGEFTDIPGTVSGGDTVQVRHLTHSEFGKTDATILNIGGETGEFETVTEVRDITPDAFGFASKHWQPLNVLVESHPITIRGINDAAPISITNGEYSINGADFISTTSTVNEGDTVKVRHRTSNQYDSSISTALTIGESTADFVSSTQSKPNKKKGSGTSGIWLAAILILLGVCRRRTVAVCQ